MDHHPALFNIMNIEIQTLENYSKSSSAIGPLLFDTSIVLTLPERIYNILPDNYRAVDLGSGDGKDSILIQTYCESRDKHGFFLKVDPYITHQDIIKESM
jgi:hypothetical protein